MKYWKWIIAGLIGSGIGAAIWVGVAYGTGYEVGWIAWGIGILAGVGVRMAAGGEEGPAQGIAAAAVAVVAILAAKYIVVSLHVNDAMAEMSTEVTVTPEMMIAAAAQEIIEEREEAGETVEWPPEPEDEDAPLQSIYPPDVWAEAEERWNALSPEEKQARTQEHKKEMTELLTAFKSQLGDGLREGAFKESFTAMDALWFILAAVSAYKIGSGADARRSPK
jgi:hypothetical protein